MDNILNKMTIYALIANDSDIWTSMQPIIYPEYTQKDIEDFYKMIDENSVFDYGGDSIKKIIVEKPTDRYCFSTALSIPFEKISDELKNIEKNQNSRNDGFKFWAECVCFEIFKWRLKINK